jgi:hypothetical protein
LVFNKMEDKTTQQMITTSTKCVQNECGKVLAGRHFEERREMKPEWEPQKFQKELRVLAWALSLGPDHPDYGFFRGGECNKCSGCSDEFNLLHYTSEKNAYCVRCYLDGFCTVIDDDTIFMAIIKKTERILIEIHKQNE